MKNKVKNFLTEQEGQRESLALIAKLLSGETDGLVRKALVLEHDTPPVISIPDSMTKLDAAKELKRQWEEEETEIDVQRKFDGWKWQDVLVAISITAEQYFGWINAQQSFMNPPREIQVIVDYKNGLPIKRTCFMGEFQVLALDEGTCNIYVNSGHAGVSFNVKKKFRKHIEQWFDLIDQHLRTKSIYRGKSVVVRTDKDEFGSDVSFEITETRSNPKVILNAKERSVVEQYCKLDMREHGKRTYLFNGDYGNGKTEAAMMLGDTAKELGMVFFYVKDSKAFVNMLSIAAKYYTPAFIFMEDIDEIGSGNERDAGINQLLNTLDGAETKNKNIKVLFTTNHPNQINPALRRPGRLDLIVRFNNPARETVKRIYETYFKGVAGSETLDYDSCAMATPDCSGAFVAEISKRALRLAELSGSISNEIVIAAINTISDHLALMEVEIDNKKPDVVSLIADKVVERLEAGVNVEANVNLRPVLNEIASAKAEIKNQTATAAKKTYDKIEGVKADTVEIKEAVS